MTSRLHVRLHNMISPAAVVAVAVAVAKTKLDKAKCSNTLGQNVKSIYPVRYLCSDRRDVTQCNSWVSLPPTAVILVGDDDDRGGGPG